MLVVTLTAEVYSILWYKSEHYYHTGLLETFTWHKKKCMFPHQRNLVSATTVSRVWPANLDAACGSVCLVAVPESSKCWRLYVSPQWLQWPIEVSHDSYNLIGSAGFQVELKKSGPKALDSPFPHVIMSWSMLGKSQGSLVPRLFFATWEKFVWWKAYSVPVPSTRMLAVQSGCFAKVKYLLHGNNGDQESWAIEAVRRRLGYTGLKPDHKKAIRSFRNGRDVLRACQMWMDRLNASKIAPESIAEKGFLSRIVISWRSEPPGKTIFATKCLRMALSCATVVPHFIWCHILHSYKCYVTIFCNCRERKRNRPSTTPIFPCVVKNGLGTRLEPGFSLLDNP